MQKLCDALSYASRVNSWFFHSCFSYLNMLSCFINITINKSPILNLRSTIGNDCRSANSVYFRILCCFCWSAVFYPHTTDDIWIKGAIGVTLEYRAGLKLYTLEHQPNWDARNNIECCLSNIPLGWNLFLWNKFYETMFFTE